MDKFVQPYDKECMKMAMLKHEETFKEQVYELHRLYQIQKMLMKNMHISTQINHQENICFNNNYQQEKSNFDLEQPATKEYNHVIEKLDDDQYIVEDECEIELTLAPTSFNRRRSMTNKPKSFESIPSFSSSSSGSNHIKRVDRITINNTNSSSDRSSLKQPPWMYQVLSLKMT